MKAKVHGGSTWRQRQSDGKGDDAYDEDGRWEAWMIDSPRKSQNFLKTDDCSRTNLYYKEGQLPLAAFHVSAGEVDTCHFKKKFYGKLYLLVSFD